MSKKALEYGIDAQMFHYLYAYCGDDKLPVGVTYHTVALPEIKITPDTKASDVEESIDKTFKRRGVALDDRDIVSAMNENPSFVPIKYKKDGDISKASAPYAFTPEEFAETKESLKRNVLDAGKAIFDVKMYKTPNDKIKGKDPCKYCKLSPFCRGKNAEQIVEDKETEGDDANG
ncbi:MAG: PD-(D/E)XK nuclease family protein [Clostridiales bacterium]|nr:PD-(D/E)XK nuclease family protein [Candidatus Coliplasma equi]